MSGKTERVNEMEGKSDISVGKEVVKYDFSFSQSNYDGLPKSETNEIIEMLGKLSDSECEKPRNERTVVVGNDVTFTVLRKLIKILEKTSYSPGSSPTPGRTRSGIIFSGSGGIIVSPWGTFHTYQDSSINMEEFAKINKIKWIVGSEDEHGYKNYYLEECDGVKIQTSLDYPINRDIWEFSMRDLIKKDWNERCELEKK